MRTSVVFLAVAVLISYALGQSDAQQKSGAAGNKQGSAASQKDPLRKTLLDLTDQVNELKERIRTLETEQSELRARLVEAERPKLVPADLSEAALELARFDCEPEFNRAHAMALAQETQSYAFEGAAALNCTQRLAKITEKAVHGLANH
jgi:TolA-binding protein